jgi:hypothetical protein
MHLPLKPYLVYQLELVLIGGQRVLPDGFHGQYFTNVCDLLAVQLSHLVGLHILVMLFHLV